MGRISVDRYVAAFETWADVTDANSQVKTAIGRCGDYLKRVHPGNVDIEKLCKSATDWYRTNFRTLMPDVGKSCLMGRMIYGGEDLRIRKCPIHNGGWSGCSPYACPAGCGYGINLTGWLPNDLVDEWPLVDADRQLDELAVALRDSWDAGHAAVYADRLQALGDPRGELITTELALASAPTPELADRHAALLATCFGDLRSTDLDELRTTRGLGDAAQIRLGFVEARIAKPDDIRKIYNARNGRYLRRLEVRGEASAVSGSLAMLSIRPHAWLAELVLVQEPLPRYDSASPSREVTAALGETLSVVSDLEIRGRGVLADCTLPAVRRLRVDRPEAITIASAPQLENLEVVGPELDAIAAEAFVRRMRELAPGLRATVTTG